ncbi:SGNH/GDSL hydrolase family protein [Flavobacteriaceae bacterium]|nr:SGNH/GDSL hydrolase family protein [Flavobacteriaceae bacterium]MDA8763066.1 SGNH/GDSL hydrolase family protein [Flavobacteriaceae bacterium]MDB2314176.1 SGNH/GDSL hydrolase family protein [Flavobacteriaceae bacterium]
MQSINSQEKTPLDGVNVSELLMHLDWPNMARFDAQNKEVDSDNTDNRVVFMGNSITEGWASYMPEMFDNQTYINRGIGGQTTPQMLLRFRQDVIAHQPKVVVILAGTNDIAGNTPLKDLETVAGHLFSMAELARQHDIKVILCSVVPAAEYPWRKGKRPDVKIPQLNKMIQDYCNENKIHYLDYFSAMTDGNGGLIESYGYDGVHPDEDGYKVMTKLVEKALDQLLDR